MRPPEVKRVADFVLATSGLVVTMPLLATVALVVWVTLGWPIVFVQERAGLGNRIFRMYKFRTMTNARDAAGELLPDAERLTRLGQVLRATSLDELPELFNVTRGEMSLVGPRPLPARYLGRYSPKQARRHEVRPGITGWAQVNGRNRLSWEEKFEYDVWYVDNRSLLLDFRILARTAWKIVEREGISQEDHATMEEFLGS
jgi:sugar transferase EpsL